MTSKNSIQNSKLLFFNLKSIGILLAVVLALTSCSSNQPLENVYRINCGSTNEYTDNEGKVWAADVGFSESTTVIREKTLKIHNTSAPEVYRTERYNMSQYILPVEQGTYTIHFHFAETFDSNFDGGGRSFGVSVNGKTVVEDFNPYKAAGGFAMPVIIEYAGCTVTNQILIEFTKNATIYGIEVFKSKEETLESINQITPVHDPSETFIGKQQESLPDAERLKVLFIGNSITFFWAIPESLEAMLETGTNNIRIEPQRSLYGGKWLEYHYNNTDAVELIKNGGFDYVVLQEGSDYPLKETELFFEYGGKFDSIIRESGAKTLLYPSPIYFKNTDADRKEVMQHFVELSKQIDAQIIPVCETLRLCYEQQPNTIWHNADGVHMGMNGGYAVACTFYAALTDGAPFPPPAILAQQVEIDPELALFIQEKALEAVNEYYIE